MDPDLKTSCDVEARVGHSQGGEFWGRPTREREVGLEKPSQSGNHSQVASGRDSGELERQREGASVSTAAPVKLGARWQRSVGLAHMVFLALGPERDMGA